MNSAVIKRSVTIAGHKTSVSLEDSFWDGLREIAHDRHVTMSNLVEEIDGNRNHANLSSAVRMFVYRHFRTAQEQRLQRQPNAYFGSNGGYEPGLAR